MEKLHPASRQLSASSLASALKTATILTATVIIFSQDLTIIVNDALQNEATSYILAVPFIFAYLIYRKRKMFRAVIPIESSNRLRQTRHLATLSGVLLCTTALLFYWYGSYTFTPLEYHLLTLPIFAAGLTLILFNPQTLRQAAFPLAFLIFLAPAPAEILYGLGSTLSVISSEASNTIVNALGIPSTILTEYGNPTIILTRPGDTKIPFTVDIACSGIYILIGFLVFAAFIAYVTRGKAWKKATIFLLGFPLIILLNITRITIILIIGYHYGEQLALQAFHLLGGWALMLLGTILILTISEKAFKTQIFTSPPKSEPCSKCTLESRKENFCPYCGRLLEYPQINLRKQDLVKIAATAVAVVLLLSIQAPVFALTEGPAQIIIQTPTGEQGNTQILPQVPGYALEFIYRDTDFEQEVGQDASLLYAYLPDDKTKEPVWVTLEIASTRSLLHGWEVCLITWPQTHGYQPDVKQLDVKDVQLLQNPPIIARYFAFQYIDIDQIQAVLYWYETSTFKTNNTVEQKHVKMSLSVYPDTPEELPEIESQLATFAEAIANYWQPIITWTHIALLISHNGSILAALSAAALASTLIFSAAYKRNENKNDIEAFKKLSKTDQKMLDAVHQAQKTILATTNNLTKTYQTITKEKITTEQLLQKLSRVEKMGVIKRYITSQEDEPQLAWKTSLNLLKQ